MQTLRDLKPGDPVRVFDVNGARDGQPPSGWEGTVVKVGRALLYVSYPQASSGKPQTFRLEGGQRNDAYGHQRVQTVEQAREDERWRAAVARLRAGGLELTRRVDIPTNTLEIVADVLDALGCDDTDPIRETIPLARGLRARVVALPGGAGLNLDVYDRDQSVECTEWRRDQARQLLNALARFLGPA